MYRTNAKPRKDKNQREKYYIVFQKYDFSLSPKATVLGPYGSTVTKLRVFLLECFGRTKWTRIVPFSNPSTDINGSLVSVRDKKQIPGETPWSGPPFPLPKPRPVSVLIGAEDIHSSM